MENQENQLSNQTPKETPEEKSKITDFDKNLFQKYRVPIIERYMKHIDQKIEESTTEEDKQKWIDAKEKFATLNNEEF